jgi:hypothetical protein
VDEGWGVKLLSFIYDFFLELIVPNSIASKHIFLVLQMHSLTQPTVQTKPEGTVTDLVRGGLAKLLEIILIAPQCKS